MEEREEIISNYINAYNTFDTDGMAVDMAEDIHFENISNGEPTMVLNGLAAFKEQANQAKGYFTEREQTVTSIKHHGNESDVSINYHAVLAIDIPGGPQKGDILELTGRSVFVFNGNKIVRLTDIS